MTDWQPIETAPKDGTLVDLWISHSSWRAEYDGRHTDCRFENGAWKEYDSLCDYWVEAEQLQPLNDGGFWRASHWMSLPKPPEPPKPFNQALWQPIIDVLRGDAP